MIDALPTNTFESCVSVALFNEWQDVTGRAGVIPPTVTPAEVAGFVDRIARLSHRQEIYFRLRPSLPDPGDELLLELAFAAGARCIITHNVRDFAGVGHYGITAMTPGQFLQRLKGTP